jgi:hypothetical protein
LTVLLACPGAPPQADEVFTLTATADATLNEALPGTNDGASAILRVISQNLANRRQIVQFDLTGLDSTAAAKTSTLRMTLGTTPPARSRNVEAHLVTGATPWTEGGVTWNTRDGVTLWTSPGGDANATAADTQPTGTTGGAAVSWNIRTDGIAANIPQGWLDGSLTNLGLLLHDAVEDEAEGAIIGSLQTGTLVSAGTGTVTANLPATLDTTKSFLIFQTRSSLNRPVVTQIRGRIVPGAPPIVEFNRDTNEGSAVNIRWYVVEFTQGVRVQRGLVNQTPATVNVPIPLPLASTSQAFLLWSKDCTNTDTAWGNNDPVLGQITAVNNIQFRANAAAATHSIAWEVVEFLNPGDIFVQRFTTSMTGATPSVAVPITAVDPARSFVLAGLRHGTTGNDIGTKLIRAQLTACAPNCAAVTVDRSVTGGDAITEIAFEVVEFRTGATVQSGSQNFPAGTATANPPIAAVDISRSFAFLSTQIGGGQMGGRTAFVGDDIVGAASFTTALSAVAPFLTLQRNHTVAAADAAWFVAQLNNTHPIEAPFASREDAAPANRPQLDVSLLRNVTPGVVTAGISEITLNWAFPGGSTAVNYEGVLFARRQGGTPTFAPADGTAYTAGQVFGSDTIAANTPDFATLQVVDENGADNVIVPATAYTYRGFTRDNNAIPGAATPAPPHYSLGTDIATTTLTPGPAEKNWSYRTGAVTLSPPGLVSGTIVAGSNDAKLHSMDAVDGARRYQPAGLVGTTGGAITGRPPVIPAALTTGVDCDPGAPVVDCDISFVGDGNGDVFAFDVSNGLRVWSATVAAGGSIQGGAAVQLDIPSNAGFTPSCAPCDLVFAGSRLTGDAVSNRVVALNAATGAVVWTFQPGNMDIIVSTPVVHYETNSVWVASLSNGGTQPSLWRINTSDGTLAQSYSFGDISNSPEFSQTRRAIYAVTDAGVLHVVRTDVASCDYSLAAAAGTAVGGPVASWQSATDDDIYFVTTNTMNKFHLTLVPFTCGSDTLTDLNGSGWTNPALSNPSGAVVVPTPVVPSALVFVGDDTGRLRRIDPVTGAIAASRDVELGSIIGEPAIDLVSNRILAGSSSGRIFSFNLF